jgi:hypothetical protein
MKRRRSHNIENSAGKDALITFKKVLNVQQASWLLTILPSDFDMFVRDQSEPAAAQDVSLQPSDHAYHLEAR